jgi:mannose/fructose/N-acetylgalactosamine-specific phosphotransferase system component IIC
MTATNHLFAALSTIEFMVLLAIVLAIAIAGIVMLVVYFKNKNQPPTQDPPTSTTNPNDD